MVQILSNGDKERAIATRNYYEDIDGRGKCYIRFTFERVYSVHV
jgi:hypothetical protein